jgi:hypothetical protein
MLYRWRPGGFLSCIAAGNTTDLAASRTIAGQLQEQVFTTAAFVPLGQWRTTTAWRTTLTGQQKGSFPVFWDIALV